MRDLFVRRRAAALPRLLILAALMVMAGACAPKRVPLVEPPVAEESGEDKAAIIWQRFAARAKAAEGMTGPFRVSATLRYTDNEGKNTRASGLLWGNGKTAAPHPLRLDLTAGPGVVVAKAREDASSFLVYVPDEKSAYRREGKHSTLTSFGVPVPLSLGDLTLLVSGQSGALFLPSVSAADSGVPTERSLTENGARYILPGSRLPGELELSEDGAPVSWKELGREGWSMVFEPGDMDPLKPRRVRVSHVQGWSALMVVKEISRVSPPYSTAQLDLPLPPGTETKPIE
ncbi:MAG: hypothetical protein LBH65_04100 [Desulfovibrio sp.]|jgi:hypothetical protein|nr:hypothetical protein [Desulfovibrio sp.]